MKKKNIAGVVLTTAAVLGMTFSAYAGQWKKNNTGWWYDYGNGSWPAGCWQWIDGNNDGVSECYYFDMSGYMLSNTTTPDGYTVNGDGAWVKDNSVQKKTTAVTEKDVKAALTAERQKDFANIIKGFMYVSDDEDNFTYLNGLLNGRKDLDKAVVSQALGMAFYFGLCDDIVTYDGLYFVYNKTSLEERLTGLFGQDCSEYLKADLSKDGTQYRILEGGDIGAEEPYVDTAELDVTGTSVEVYTTSGWTYGDETGYSFGLIYEVSYTGNSNKNPFMLKSVKKEN